MQYDEIKITLLQILSFPQNKEKYLTIDQICNNIRMHFPIVLNIPVRRSRQSGMMRATVPDLWSHF